jgi:hypothetical protein
VSAVASFEDARRERDYQRLLRWVAIRRAWQRRGQRFHARIDRDHGGRLVIDMVRGDRIYTLAMDVENLLLLRGGWRSMVAERLRHMRGMIRRAGGAP